MLTDALPQAHGAPERARRGLRRPHPLPRVEDFAGSSLYRALLDRAVTAVPPSLFTRCSALVSGDSRVNVGLPITFNADGLPVAGLWRHSFSIRGGGNDTTLNFFCAATGTARCRVIVSVPGCIHAKPALQRQVVPFATRQGARSAPPMPTSSVSPATTDDAQRNLR